jgi:hypothetical protein
MTTPGVQILEEGARARLTRDITDDGFPFQRAGFEFVIEEFLAAADNPDPEPGDIAVDFYYGNANGGMNNVCVPADAVEQVMSAQQMSQRMSPSMAEIRDQIAGGLLGDFDTFETDETDRDGFNGVEVYGRTHEGLAFGFRVKVTDIWLTDL